MHDSKIQQSRVSSEDLLADVLTRYEWPKKRLVRVYDNGVEPVEPNPYKFAVIATINPDKCTIQALAQPQGGLKLCDVVAGFQHLKQFGAVSLHWRHNGEEKVFS